MKIFDKHLRDFQKPVLPTVFTLYLYGSFVQATSGGQVSPVDAR